MHPDGICLVVSKHPMVVGIALTARVVGFFFSNDFGQMTEGAQTQALTGFRALFGAHVLRSSTGTGPKKWG